MYWIMDGSTSPVVICKTVFATEFSFLPSMDAMMSLSLQVALIVGLVFQMPLLIYVILSSGWLTVAWIRHNRGYWVGEYFLLQWCLLLRCDFTAHDGFAIMVTVEVTMVFFVCTKSKLSEVLD